MSGNLDKVAVSAKDASGNTIEIMQDAINGWSYTDATKTAIILNGDACNNLKSVTYTGFPVHLHLLDRNHHHHLKAQLGGARSAAAKCSASRALTSSGS